MNYELSALVVSTIDYEYQPYVEFDEETGDIVGKAPTDKEEVAVKAMAFTEDEELIDAATFFLTVVE